MGVLSLPSRSISQHLLAPILLTVLAAACGQQDPAFTEKTDSNLEARAADATNSNGIDDQGNRVGGMAGGDGSEPLLDASIGAPGDGTGSGTEGGVNGDGSTAGSGATGGNGSGTDTAGAGTGTGAGTGGNESGTGGTAGTGGSGGTGGTAGTGGSGTPGNGANTGTETITGLNQRSVEFVQKGAGKVDILWVVDTSGSMAEEQQYLAANFNAMIGQLASAGHNFQTAVTTTDVCDDSMPAALKDRSCPADYGGTAATHLRGTFVGDAGKKVLKQGQADLVSRFNTYTKQGVDGSGFEHGLKAAQLATTKSLSGLNEGLVRPDAFLAVVVVSDEEDDGIGMSLTDAYNGHNFYAEGLTEFRYTEDDMISYLQAVKGAGRFSVSAITPTRQANGSLCSAPHSQPLEEGTQYIKAAQKSGGIVQSICDTNWSASLANIGLDLSAQITQLTLQSAADPATIKVWVNGAASTQWTYNSGNNAVKFNAGHVPAEGANIKVTYFVR